jgi:hypothetical protein
MPEFDWASALDKQSVSPEMEHRLTRVLTELHRVIVFTPDDAKLLVDNETLPETINVTARDVPATIVAAIESASTAHPTRSPYSL